MIPPSISVIVPVFNSRSSLPELARRLNAVLDAVTPSFEIILVNDGSADDSWNVIQRLADEHVRGIELSRNSGQHNALLCGIRAARHAIIVTLDDDLQHPPEEIPRLLEALDQGQDVVYGTPAQAQHAWWRDGASLLTRCALRHIMGVSSARHVSAFRAFRTNLREAFAEFRGPFVSIDVLLSWATTRFAAVPTRHEPRRLGHSNYNARKLIVHALNLVTGFSTAPLHFASLAGLAATFLGVLVLAFVGGRYLLEGSSVPGFPFLASIVAIFSGTQLFTLGIVGEYVARTHFRVMDRPAYTIRTLTAPE